MPQKCFSAVEDRKTCRYKCDINIPKEQQEQLFKEYYGFGEDCRQKAFLSSLVVECPVSRKRKRNPENRQRKKYQEYTHLRNPHQVEFTMEQMVGRIGQLLTQPNLSTRVEHERIPYVVEEEEGIESLTEATKKKKGRRSKTDVKGKKPEKELSKEIKKAKEPRKPPKGLRKPH
ncbi:hypothetical protein J6590_054512 [Homalodisca vitripennis]|nr:hypothetical protein J6590_054512 [Homalodisca vitripennis]